MTIRTEFSIASRQDILKAALSKLFCTNCLDAKKCDLSTLMQNRKHCDNDRHASSTIPRYLDGTQCG